MRKQDYFATVEAIFQFYQIFGGIKHLKCYQFVYQNY